MRSCLVLAVMLTTTGCNLWPGGLGHVDLPREADARSIRQLDLESEATAESRTIEEGMEAIRARDGQPAPRDEAPGELVPVTVSQLRGIVLQNNLDLDVALLAPEIARAKISAEEGKFDALIGSKFEYGRLTTPRLDGPLVDFSSANPALDDEVVKLTELEQERELLKAGVGVKVPLPTGGTISVGSLLDSKSIVDPQSFDQYLAATRFSFSQPLLRNAGLDANLAPIRLARVDHRMTQVRTKLAALRVLARSEKAYWRLYAARRFLDVRVEQHRLASEGLALVKRLVSEGLVAPVEVIRAEVGVYKRLETLIVAETEWRLRQRDLKRQMASDRFPLRGGAMIDIGTEPRLAGLTLDADALVEQALQTRPELIEVELGLVRDGLSIDLRRNQTLPIVNLDFRYGVLDRDDSFASAWSSNWDFDNQDLFVGLEFEMPFTNQRRRAALQQAILTRTQRLATKAARELAVREEVLDMVDIIDRNWQRIVAARQNVIVAGVNYDAEQRQFDAGMRTMREVLEALSDLGDAQLREIRAIVDYQVAQIDLAFATGTLLGYARVGLEPIPVQ